ncbi:sulfotransferase ssu-1-like [Amblyomma americanum]
MAARKAESMFQVIDGERYIFFRDPTKVREALRYQPREGDIIEVAYPKCGMQMMQQMIQLIVHDGRVAKNFGEFSARAPHLEDCGGSVPDGAPLPRLFRTHIRLGKIAVNPAAKYIYVARNPWDACYSQYIFNRQMPVCPLQETFDEFLNMFLDGALTNGSYFEHVKSGYTRRGQPNVFFATYEDMVRDPAGTLQRLADFLGKNYGERFRNDKELLASAAEKCTPTYLKSLLQVETGRMAALMIRAAGFSEAVKAADVGQGSFSLVCRPEVGAWKEGFTKEQLKKTVEKIEGSIGNEFVGNLWVREWREVREESS